MIDMRFHDNFLSGETALRTGISCEVLHFRCGI
jgi:hypothetical protein